MILMITKHLKNYLETFITKKNTIDKIEKKQDEFDAVINILENYIPRNNKYVEAKNKLLNHANKFMTEEKRLLKGLKTNYFQFFMTKHMSTE